MATSEHFLARWENITLPDTTASERGGNYTVLTSYLKESGVDASFIRELCRHQPSLLKRIMVDIMCKSCDHAALQLLGYCLHNVDFASLFSKEQVAITVKGVCSVIKDRNTEKSVCTRALWCLTNQQLPVNHMTNHVTSIVDMATEVITVHHVGVATICSEALNLLMRFGQQFPQLFSKLVSTWYKAIVELLVCKVQKCQGVACFHLLPPPLNFQVHQKALSLAVTYEPQLIDNHDVKRWLTKALKEHVVAAMLSQLTEKGLDHIHLIRSWSHFITVLGKTIHKHGSFLNELLRVVETGFKHRSPQVQSAAYEAWNTLVTNFSLDLTVMTAQKRLKLLLMPLLASAVRERHETVEHARIQTWWHLINCMEHHKAAHFQNICIPFLLLCLGLDPKSDVSQLANSISNLQSHTNSTMSDSSSTSPTPQTPKSSGAMHLAVTPTPVSGSAPSTAPTTPTSSLGPGRLLSSISTPRSRRGVEIEKGKKGSDRYQTPPNVSMVMTGCHALLEFTGSRDKVPHSLIKSEPGQCVVFSKAIVPMETAQFMLLFLDALLKYHSQLSLEEKGVKVDSIISHIVMVIACSMEAEDGASSALPVSVVLLVPPLVDLLCSGSLDKHLNQRMKTDFLSRLIGLSPRLLLAPPTGRLDCWKRLLAELLRCNKTEQASDLFHKNWLKLVNIATSSSVPLTNLLYLSNELSRSIKDGGVEREVCSKLWTSLANKLTLFITETSQVSNGSSLSPSFETVRSVLKFPFLHLLDNGERSDVISVMDVWKGLYETTSLHMGLVVKETNLCTELVCTDLYSAYGQYTKQVPSSLDQRHQVLRFDLYQNAMASAISYIVSKIKWGALAQSTTAASAKERGGRVKSMETLLSLLAWQLAAFWDTAKKGPLHLPQLTTPYTLLEVVESIYHHIPSSPLVTMATEMIGQPLATLFEAVMESCHAHQPSSRPRLSPQDLQHRVEKVWKSITMCFQSRHAHPYDSALLSTLSPLLVATLNSSDRQLSSLSLSFWAVTFDRSQTLDYPARLRDYFVKYLKESKQSSELKLPGLHGNSGSVGNVHKEMGNTQADQSEVIHFSDTQSHSQIWNQDLDITTDSVALPHSSPRKGSFLNRHPPTSPYKPRPAPSSPLAKQLDEVLARSATTVEKVQSSPLKVVGVADKAESPLASARRRLDLNGKSEEYKSVAPPSRKRRLLTEHQEEVMKRRRSDLPTLYNALDPALDSAPVIMDECTQSEGDPPVIKQAQPPMPSHSGVSTSESGSIPSLHSNTNHVTVSPTSRDTPITIPDSPPPTSPPSLIQHPVPMVTSTTNVSTHPSPATALHTATVPHPRGVVSPPISTPQPHPSAPPPVPHSHTVLSTSIPSHVAMTTGSFPVSVSAPPPHLSSSSVGRAVVISHPGSGSVLQIIPSHPPVAMATHDVLLPRIIQGAPPLPVHTPAMMGPEMVAQPVQQVLLPQGIQPGMPPAVLTHNINNNDIIMTSLESHRLPTYHEAVSHKVLEEAFARILGDPNASPPRRMGRAKRAPPQRKEMDAGKDREISQKQLPSEGDEGDAPGDQGEVDARLKKSENVLSSSSEVACAVEAIEDRPLTSGASSGATATPTINATPTSAIVSLTESEGHSRAVQSCDTDTRDSDQLVRLSVGGAEIEQKECPNITLEVAGVSTEPLGGVVMEDIEDPLGGVKKTKKTAEKEEGGGEKMEQAASEKVGGATLSSEAEVKVQSPISPELLSSELEEKVEGEMDVERSTELNKNEKMETANVMSDGQAKPSESNSDPAVPARTESLESEATQKSNSKVTESTEPGISDGIVKANSSGVRPPSESGEGRKRLSLRRHTTPSASAGGVESDAGFTAGEGEGAESRKSSLVDTPTNGKNGILKHTSQFDTPSTAKAGRRVQFATEPVFHEHQSKQQQTEESGQKSVTPKHSRGPRTPQGSFSSRRTLLMSHTPPKMILVNKPLPPATPTGPVYPSLKDCQSPVEQILPALSPSSKFTHGLLKLVSAQNITTVGNISSLSEQEVQTLPIKSPKVPTLRGALRVFEQQLQGSKRKSSIDGEVGLATPPPKKQPRLDSDLSSTATSSNKDSTSAIAEGSSKSAIVEDGSKSAIVEDGSKSAIDEDSSKSAIVEDGSKSAIDEDSSKSEGSTESAIAEGSTESAIVEQGRETVLPRPEGDADQSNEEDLMPDGEELSEGSHDIDGPIITLCTPESQLTPPIEAAVVSEGGAGEGGAMDDKMESVAEEEMEVEEQKRSVEDALLPETPPISPPHPSSTSQAGNTASSIGHDHTYCSQPAPDTTKSTPADVETDNKEGHVTESSDHVTESNRTTLSMMTHDHTYCSSQPRGDEVKEGRCHGRADGKGEDASNRSKLSLTVHDHTYCSNSWQQTGEPRLTAARFTPQQLPMEEGEGRALESAAGGGHVTKEASRSDTAEMETETADVGDSSDIIETDSSLSQELFSQQASQVHARGNEAPPTTEPSNDLLTSGDSRDNRNCSVASAVARGNDERSGVVEKVISADSAEKDGEREAGDRDRVSERERGWEQNIAVNSHQAKDQTPPTVSTGSEVSSDSLNPTHIAECSQRPSSANPLPSSSSSISDHTHSGDSGDLVDLLTRFTELGDKVSKLMEGKPSLSREEVLACQKAYRLVATFSQTVVDTLVQQTSNQNAAS